VSEWKKAVSSEILRRFLARFWTPRRRAEIKGKLGYILYIDCEWHVVTVCYPVMVAANVYSCDFERVLDEFRVQPIYVC